MKEYNKEKEYQKEYYQKNKEKILARQREHYQKNRVTIIARTKEYQQQNKKKISAQKKEYYQENKEKIQAREKEWRSRPENKEKMSKYQREYWQKNREEKLNRVQQLRIEKIQYLGGKCEGQADWMPCPGLCGVEDVRVLQFHHKDGRKKGDNRQPSWEDIKNGKIQLLCSNCHIIAHREMKTGQDF